MKKLLLVLIAAAAIGGSVYAYRRYKNPEPKASVSTAQITRGDVVETVGATGTLQAVTTVQVGSQVSGAIQSLYADFNSLVKKGQVLARLDPSLFQTQIEQARANLIRAQADLERLRVSLDDARTKLNRARELSQRNLIPRTDLETAEVNVRSAEAQIQSSQAQVTQAQASLNQNEVNLQHTVIEAPIDGLVISRNVDVGQTVAASMQAPTLFVLAADLTKMQVVANLDESDVGRIRPRQHVSFRVDAYPAEEFGGTVSQVRLQPTVQQNVVTYATVIDVPNPELKLKPGMTANVNVEIARSSNVLRVPNAALRFRPTNEMFTALGLTPPDPAALRGDMAGRGGMRQDGPTNGAAPAVTPPAGGAPVAANRPAPAAGTSAETERPRRERADSNATQTPGAGAPAGADAGAGRGRRGDFNERMQNLSPEQREEMLARMRARGVDPTAPGGGRGSAPPNGSGPRGGRGGQTAPSRTPTMADDAARAGGATTIDALFGPLPRVETNGRAWVHANNQLQPVRLRLGITDGQNTEIVQGDVTEGAEVVTNITTGATEVRPNPAFNPFGGPQRGGFPGGNQGGGNRNGGNNNRGGGR